MDESGRAGLAAFLRARRAARQPSEVGLPANGPRRTPGLRRQEVAELAGISVDYYIRMEQARGPHPSRQVLSALARAMMLTSDERDYLFRVAGENPPTTPGPSRDVAPAITNMLAAMVGIPAYVLDAGYNILAWNDLAAHFIGDLPDVPATERNVIRWTFLSNPDQTIWDDESTVQFMRGSVADLRVAYARYPGNPVIGSLVAELQAASPRFSAMWAEHEVRTRRTMTKRVDHPEFGPLEFTCQMLEIPDSDQRIVAYVPDPGSDTERVFSGLDARVQL